MKFYFEHGDRVQLQRLNEIAADDISPDPRPFAILVKESEDGAEYEVVSAETDFAGSTVYYGVINTATGVRYENISDYHILPTVETLGMLLTEIGIE